MDYSLGPLGPRGFEHLVQALAIAALGNGISVFGDGPDGGREATFNGQVSLPDVAGGSEWDGYGILQAKHLTHETTPAANGAWLAKQLKSELDAFLPDFKGKARRKKAPEYYLLVTNARLSAVEDTGGIDTVNALLHKYVDSLHLKGFFVWHYDQISRLLDAHPGVRQTYAGVVTSGDLIAMLMEIFGGPVAHVGKHLSVNAAVELRARQWVRLGDSGLDHDGKLRLDQVAIDVPSLIADPLRERSTWTEAKVIRRILTHGGESKRRSQREGSPGGIVVVGGPGQGKSTVAQIVCQAFRTSLLRDSSALSAEQIKLVRANEAAINRMGLEIPTYRRWPIYVELSQFGDALAANPDMSLLTYIAGLVKAEGTSLTASQLARWRGAWPWIVVLDGLDEVAALQTRSQVVAAIDEFLTDANFADDDVLVVATTRPQGYKGELGEFGPEQLELRPLTATESAKYGQLLVRVRLFEDPELAAKVTARLVEAASREITARLMTTPLQVTIMSTLLERLHRVPDTRHALFDEYYRSIYNREESKAGRLGDLLGSHKPVIDYVHEQAALYLHVQAEKEGQSEALLSESALRALFVAKLRTDGYDKDSVASLSEDLLRAARDRVVLLVGAKQDHVGFEVRSIQEYLAGRAISSGPDFEALNRLGTVAPSAHWRNVWLLAAGKMFAHEHQRDALLEQLRQYDTKDIASMLSRVGERIALDMLEDDFALSLPRHRRSLLVHALRLLEQWPDPQLRRLAGIAGPEMARDIESAAIVRSALTRAFESSGAAKASAVLVLREWAKTPGTAGALANRLLDQSKDWRPEGAPNRARKSISEIVKIGFNEDGLSAEQLEVWRKTLRVLKQHKPQIGLTAAELATYAKNFQPLNALDFDSVFSDEDLLVRFVDAIDTLPLEKGAAAVYIRQLLVTLGERRTVGSDPAISSPGLPLFE